MKSNKKNILILLIISILVMIPLYINNCYIIKDDSEFHIANIISTISTMDNFIPKDILPNLMGNLGVAVRQFYPILSHTFVAYLCKFTSIDVTVGLEIAHTLVLFLSGVTMYYLSLRIFKDKKYALVSSVIYMLFPYHLNEIYVRDALAENFIFVFIPLIIHGLTYLFEDKKKFLILFCSGYIFGMLSHFTMMVYFTICLIPFFIIYRKKVFKKDTIITLITAGMFILLVMSPMIVNLFQNKFMGDYRVFTPNVMAQGIQHDGLLMDFVNYFGIFDKLTYNDPGKRFYFDVVVLFMLFILFKNRKKIDFKKYKFIVAFGVLTFAMSLLIFPWDLLPVSFRIIQFPWRLISFYSITVSLLAPLSLKYIKIDYKYLVGAMVILAFIFHTETYAKVYDPNNFNFERGIGWQHEYLSNDAYNNIDKLKEMEYKVYTDSGDSKIISEYFPDITFEITEDTNVTIPRLYYLGYELVDSNGNNYDISKNDYSLITANLKKGEYTLKYVKTKIVRIGEKISIISIGIGILYIIVLYKFDKKR